MKKSSSPTDSDVVDSFQIVNEEAFSLHGIFRLVTGRLSLFNNIPSAKFDLRYTLACGNGLLAGADSRYKVRLRQCIVDISTKGCTADLGSAYSFQLPDTEITESFSKEETGTSGREAGLDLFVDNRFSLRDRANMALKGRLSKETSSKIGRSRSSKGKRRVMLISCNGQHWTVGDDQYGDPRNEDGTLWERYFIEDPTKPLCSINLDPDVNKARILIEVRARYGQLDIDLLDEAGKVIGKAGKDHLEDVSRIFRSRLRGFAYANAVHKYQATRIQNLPPSEFILSRSTLEIQSVSEKKENRSPILQSSPRRRSRRR